MYGRLASTNCDLSIVDRPVCRAGGQRRAGASCWRWRRRLRRMGSGCVKPPRSARASEGPFFILGKPTVANFFEAVFERRVRNAVGALFAAVLIGGRVVRLGEGALRFGVRPLHGAGQLVSLGFPALCCLRHSYSPLGVGSSEPHRLRYWLPMGGVPTMCPNQPKGIWRWRNPLCCSTSTERWSTPTSITWWRGTTRSSMSGMEVPCWRILGLIGRSGSELVRVLLGDDTGRCARLAREKLHTKYFVDSAPLVRRLPGARELLEAVAERGLASGARHIGRRGRAGGVAERARRRRPRLRRDISPPTPSAQSRIPTSSPPR